MKKYLIIGAVVLVLIAAYIVFKPGMEEQPPVEVDSEQPIEQPDLGQPRAPDDTGGGYEEPTGPTTATRITFYEGNGCSQDIVATYGPKNAAGRIGKNDEARSLSLVQVPAGTRIFIYDSPDAKENDDFAFILVKKKTFEYCIRTLEASIYTDNVEMTYTRKNGLDGKVSYVKIEYP